MTDAPRLAGNEMRASVKTISNTLITIALLVTFPIVLALALVRTSAALTLAWGAQMLDVWQ